MEIESTSVESTENDSSDVKTLGVVLHYSCQSRLCVLLLFITRFQSLLKRS